jgi:tetratricopeptide (TPR) repeat protein
MMSTLRMMTVASLLVTLLPARPAHAVDKRAASVHFQRGRALFEAANWPAALEEFNAGYDAFPLPGFLVNIGQCLRKLDRPDEASVAFQQFLDTGSDPRLRAEVQEALAEIAAARPQRAEPVAPVAPTAPARADLTAHAPAAPTAAVASASLAGTALTAGAAPRKKSKKWVWAVVGVLAAGAVGAAVGVAILETQPQSPRPGSLGELDGRR